MKDNANVGVAASEEQEKRKEKKKPKRSLWPLKVCLITFVLAMLFNASSELVLEGASLWLSILLVFIILVIGVLFDIIGTASTSCDVEPFLSMASRKVKGAKTAVKLAKNSDIVSSVCNDVIGDICGIVSGVCAASIAVYFVDGGFALKIVIYAIVSTLTITFKAIGKGVAVSKANDIVFGVAKFLRIFSRED